MCLNMCFRFVHEGRNVTLLRRLNGNFSTTSYWTMQDEILVCYSYAMQLLHFLDYFLLLAHFATVEHCNDIIRAEYLLGPP